MALEDEIKGIGSNLQELVTGDIEIGGQSIPKIIPVGVVVGIVAFLAIRAGKNKSTTQENNGDGGLFGSSGGTTANSQTSGDLPIVDDGSSDGIFDSVFSDIADNNPFPSYFDDNIGTGFYSTLPDTYQYPVTPEYNLPEQISGYSDYNPNVPYMTAANPLSDSSGNLYSVPQNVANKVQKSNSAAIINSDKSLVASINAAFGKSTSPLQSALGKANGGVSGIKPTNPLVSSLQSVLGKASGSVSGLSPTVKPLTPQQVQLQSKVVVPLQNAVKPIQSAIGAISSIFNIGNKPSTATSKGSVTGLGNSPIAVSSKAPPKPVVASVKPPQVIATRPSVSASKVVVSPVPAKKPVTVTLPKVGGKSVVLR